MLDTSNLTNFLQGITNAIRIKKGTTNPIQHALIDEEIASIQTGITPIGTIDITENGQVDVTNFASANVNVQGQDTGVGSRQWWLDILSVKTNFSYQFNLCTSLTTIPQLDTSKGTNFSYMFNGCTSLTTLPQLNTSKGTNFGSMFTGCTSLTTIPQLDTSKGTSTTALSAMFFNCSSLTTISFVPGSIKMPISFSDSSKLSDESIQSIIDGLYTYTSSSRKLTLGSALTAKLTDEQMQTILSKKWTVG